MHRLEADLLVSSGSLIHFAESLPRYQLCWPACGYRPSLLVELPPAKWMPTAVLQASDLRACESPAPILVLSVQPSRVSQVVTLPSEARCVNWLCHWPLFSTRANGREGDGWLVGADCAPRVAKRMGIRRTRRIADRELRVV